ncbi:isocitrate/isopropylmalate dehydrogenase family protein [Xylophilus rhododendri]|uniref:3-isopropylmalate dehydrogenase n=1 Tax=Xylophilus rhododendri TaxID=2697032 RepID=A0A857JBG6_9BURK|nr:isocitrate/isopropylmalate dehydrogenase family protein [Xylophilus rhododendri]QHJ01287.1 isocitrate/isopropylmalate dehydrogenase family protein [Xylophilus rhododendri]
MKDQYQIAVLPGDGIGREVMAACEHVLQAVEKRVGIRLGLQWLPAGAQHYVDTGDALPQSTLKACEAADAILFGAMGLPHVRGADGTEIIPQLDLRMHFDLYAGVRPIRTFAGLPTPLSHPRAQAIDLVLVRENTEGLFYARGRGDVRGDEEVFDTMRITRKGTSRICEFAFGLAERRARRLGRQGHVTNVDKANVFASMAFFRKVFEEVAARHAGVGSDSAYVDAMALNLVLKPWNYDVLVTENMFGDILSDLIAALVGGMGMAPSGDIGDRVGLFQPAHGTAPDIAGQGKANPTAMILSAAMMLDWLAGRSGDARLGDAAALIERSVEQVFASGGVRPMEFGGAHGTREITEAVTGALAEAMAAV